MRKTILLFLATFLFSVQNFGQTFNLSGVITDETTGEALIGATVTSGEKGTVTDLDGKYELALEAGRHTVTFSYVAYNPIEKTIDINSDTQIDVKLNSMMLEEVVVTADIAIERKTPVAFSNIPTLKLQEELASQDIPLILNSTPGAYATQSGGGDGDARITIRGFNQRNVAVMLDGVPVNDMENGWVYWANWFGLDLVTQTMQVQRGLGASKLSIPSVGGTINILTKGIDAKKGIKLKQEFGSGSYLRTTLGVTTGRLKNGWGASLAASYKQGNGWVDGTYTKGYFYYLRVDKQLGNHLLGFQAFGAPQKHGQRPFTAEIGQIDVQTARDLGVPEKNIEQLSIKDKGRKYNEHWGYHNGKLYNTRNNYYHKPQISLRHSWQVNPKLYNSNVAYLSIGNGGGTAPNGLFFRDSSDQFDIDKTAENNKSSIFNPDGLSNSYLRTSINNHFWYGLLSTAKYEINKLYTFSGGLDLRSYQGQHWREPYDLLGGTGIQTDRGIVKLGEKYDYDYTGFVRWAGVFGLLEYSNGKTSAFLNISGANTGYRAEDYYRNQKLDWINLWTGTIKAGFGYNINDKNNFFFNTGYLNKAQRFTNVININRFGDSMSIFNNFENENIWALEAGYGFKSRYFSFNANAYYTNWLNKPLDRAPTVARDPNDPDSERVPVNIPGIDALHKGIEFQGSFQPTKKLAIETILSLGDWIWNSSSTGFVDLGNGIKADFEFDATGVHVGDAAQTQIGGLIRYEFIKKGYIKLKGTYFDRNWSDFQPETLKPNSPSARKESWQLPSYTIFDLHTGYGTKIKKSWVNFKFNILNLLDTKYISDGRNNDRFNEAPSDEKFDAASATVHFGQGRRWTASIQLSF